MKNLKTLITALAFVPSLILAQNKSKTNPLLSHSNTPVAFHQFTPAAIKDAASAVVKNCDSITRAIAAVPQGEKTIANTLMRFDEIGYIIGDLDAKLRLVSSTYPDDAARNEANTQLAKLGWYATNLYLMGPLYKALKSFEATNVETLNVQQQKFLREFIILFEINGMKLDKKGRDALAITSTMMFSFGSQFDNNLAGFQDSIAFSSADLAGVPPQYTDAWKRPNDKFMISINGPNYINLGENANLEATRHAIYLKYYNRAYPINMHVLDSLFFYRQQLAQQLGYKTYAAYALATKMAGKPENVWSFLDDLQVKLTPLVKPELDELKAIKQRLQPAEDPTIEPWDLQYYNKKLLDSKYSLNTDEVKKYFEMDNTINGMFAVYEKLFNIKIHEVKGLPVWSEKVKSYELWMDEKKMGTFFLDLYPRPNKYTHFETAPVSLYRVANGQEVLPVGALICNFPEGTAIQPSLLNHADVETMFHEFGHLIHFLVCHPVISQQNAFTLKGDFAEAPSQFLENFCWNYDCLKLFARDYKTGEVLPKSIFDKMLAAKNALVGINYIGQVYFAKIDFTYEDRFNSMGARGVDGVEKDLWPMRQTRYPEGTHFICGFNHLNDYGANYYGYLWSQVYAQDLFSVFEEHGVLDQVTGVRYRKEILEKGAQEDEMTMLKGFLGREPNSKAFLKSLAIN
jgi:thimet oligopeptidase